MTTITLAIPEGQELRPYQKMGAAYLIARERMLLADDPGLGKTIQALVAINTLGCPDTLVVCPKNAIGVWEVMAEEWLGIKPKTFTATRAKNSDVKSPGMLITNYEQLRSIYKLRNRFPIIIFDESHKIRNRNTKVYTTAKYFSARYLWFMTGTPVFKGAHDLWSTLAMISPNSFPAYWPFVNRYCNQTKGWGGSMQVWGIKDPLQLAKDISPFFLRRLRKEVLKDLPEKFRFRVPLHMTPVQRIHYINLFREMMTEVNDDEMLLVPSAAVRTIRLRELLVSPRILGIDDDGAAIPELMEKLEERGTPSLVYTPFKLGVKYISEYARARGWEAIEMTGELNSPRITEAVKTFQMGTNPKRILVATVQMGTAWTGTAAKQTWFVGYDWAPQINVQAEDRMNRYGGSGYECGYFTHIGTVDEHVMDVLSGKVTIENLIINHKFLLDMGRL